MYVLSLLLVLTVDGYNAQSYPDTDGTDHCDITPPDVGLVPVLVPPDESLY